MSKNQDVKSGTGKGKGKPVKEKAKRVRWEGAKSLSASASSRGNKNAKKYSEGLIDLARNLYLIPDEKDPVKRKNSFQRIHEILLDKHKEDVPVSNIKYWCRSRGWDKDFNTVTARVHSGVATQLNKDIDEYLVGVNFEYIEELKIQVSKCLRNMDIIQELPERNHRDLRELDVQARVFTSLSDAVVKLKALRVKEKELENIAGVDNTVEIIMQDDVKKLLK